METIILGEKTITFVPTAHVSAESVNEVKSVIESLQPDTVCVELDRQRAKAMENPEAYKDTDIIKIIKEKRTSLFFVNLLLSSYQKRIAKNLNVKVGSEMQQAITSAKAIDAKIEYIDRNVQITFKRMLASLSGLQKLKLLYAFLLSDDESLSEEDIEKMKEQDVLQSALNQMSNSFPAITNALLDERNAVMAHHIKQLKGQNIVVVIGAAHLQGIIDELNQTQDIQALNEIPKKKPLAKILPWVVPGALVIMLVALTIWNQSGLGQFGWWMILSTGLATLGAILSLAHPVTILVTFLTTWIGALSPFLAVGWFAGLSEAYFKKPKVRDFESLFDDLTSFRKIRKNRLLHILIVMLMTNVMSTIGTLIASMDIVKSFFQLF